MVPVGAPPHASGRLLGLSWVIPRALPLLGPSRRLLGPSGAPPGPSWRSPGSSWGPPWRLVGRRGEVLGASWAVWRPRGLSCGLLGGLLGASRGHPGGVSGASWGVVGAPRGLLGGSRGHPGAEGSTCPFRSSLRGRLGRLLGRFWHRLGRLGAFLGAAWAAVERSWEPLWAVLERWEAEKTRARHLFEYQQQVYDFCVWWPSWECSWRVVGASWRLRKPSGGHLGRLGPIVRRLESGGTVIGGLWGRLGALVGPKKI